MSQRQQQQQYSQPWGATQQPAETVGLNYLGQGGTNTTTSKWSITKVLFEPFVTRESGKIATKVGISLALELGYSFLVVFLVLEIGRAHV